MFSPLEQFNFIPVAYWGFFDPNEHYWQAIYNDYGFSQFIIPFLLVRAYFYFFFDDVDYYHLVPRAPQRIFEMKAIFVFNLIKQQLGSEHYDYFVIVYTVFFGILYLNLISLLPFGTAVTSQIEVMLFISLLISLGFFFTGIIARG
jgi:F0F1-type ATP synthase membrane subunit a